MKTERRPYRQTARAERVQETRGRILDAGMELFLTRWFDEVTLGDLAREAGVSQQTVVNHFGGKAGVLLAVAQERMTPEIEDDRHRAAPGDVEGAIAALVDDYERTGDGVIRALALEERVPDLQPVLALGRAAHRRWVTHAFGPFLDGLAPAERDERVEMLAVALDVYVWKLLRRDGGRSREDTALAMRRLLIPLIPPQEGS
jgi:AcrR family transcriptional regulator